MNDIHLRAKVWSHRRHLFREWIGRSDRSDRLDVDLMCARSEPHPADEYTSTYLRKCTRYYLNDLRDEIAIAHTKGGHFKDVTLELSRCVARNESIIKRRNRESALDMWLVTWRRESAENKIIVYNKQVETAHAFGQVFRFFRFSLLRSTIGEVIGAAGIPFVTSEISMLNSLGNFLASYSPMACKMRARPIYMHGE